MKAEVRELIITLHNRGLGASNSDPIREIVSIFEKDGTLIAEKDQWWIDRQQDILLEKLKAAFKAGYVSAHTPNNQEFELDKFLNSLGLNGDRYGKE